MEGGFVISQDLTLKQAQKNTDLFGRNCVFEPLLDYRSSIDNRRYGGYLYKGCRVDEVLDETTKVYIDPANPSAGYSTLSVPAYRPSDDSLMNYGKDHRFNVISCGYIIAAIKGEPIDKAHAEKYWPECVTFDTINKHGISGDNPIIPIILSATTNRVGTSISIIVSASGLTATKNSVQLVNTADNSKIYEIIGLPSSRDRRTLSFALPAGIIPGIYTLKVGAFNSNWSNVISVSTVLNPKDRKPTPTLPSRF